MSQQSGLIAQRAKAKEKKKERMQSLVTAVISEYKAGEIQKGLWKIAEEQGLNINTLCTWRNDPDWQEISEPIKQARRMIVEHKLDKAITKGEGLQWAAVLVGILNRIDPVASKVEHTGSVAYEISTGIDRGPAWEEQPAQLPAEGHA